MSIKKAKNYLISFIFLFTPLLFVTALLIFEVDAYLDHQYEEFENATSRMKYTIKDEMQKFVLGLNGAKGLISAIGPNIAPEQFRRYAKSRQYFFEFSGSLGFGFIRSVERKNLNSYLIERRKWNANFSVHPATDEDQLMIIEIIEPIEKNGPALGLNIGFENKRRSAALRSAELGIPLLTEKISLVQMGKKHTGFLYFMPVYSTIETPFTIKDRTQHLIGWAYTPVVLEKFLGTLKERLPQNIHLSIKLDDNDDSPSNIGDPFDQSLIFSNWIEDSTLIGGQNWQFTFSKSAWDVHVGLLTYLIAYLCGAGLIIFFYRYALRAYKAKNTSFANQQKWTKGIVESSSHAIIATDPNGTILTFNSAAESLLGYKADELIGIQNPGIFHLPEEVLNRSIELTKELGFEVAVNFDAFVAKARSGKSDTNEWTYVHKNGEKIKVRLTVTIIRGESDEIIGYLGIAVDLREEQKSRLTIELQRAKMIEATKMSLLGEMAGGVAHEINTPLAVIISKASTVKKLLAADSIAKDTILAHILRVEQTAQHIARIVKGLRLFSRNSESDQLTEVALNSVISLTLDLCHEKIKFNGIDLKLNIPENLKVLGRESELSQVIMNLIGNSIDAIATLPQKWIEIDCTENNNRVRLTITDSGLGIPQNVIDKMMQPFFTTKEVGKGTGLGLSISKGIIENFHGSLYYNSASKNTQFVIELCEFESYINKKAG